MARRVVVDRRKQVTDALGRMLRDYLVSHVYKDLDAAGVAQRIGIGPSIFSLPWWQDIPSIVEAVGLDLGLALRDRKGNEVTFFPEENLGTPAREPKVAAKDYTVATESKVGFHSKR